MKRGDNEDIEPPYRPIELLELKAKGVKVEPLSFNHEMDVVQVTFAVQHKSNAKAFAQPVLNMLCDMFSKDDGYDCTAVIVEPPEGPPRVIVMVPHSLFDRMDSTVVPALDYLDDDADQGFVVPHFGKRTPR